MSGQNTDLLNSILRRLNRLIDTKGGCKINEKR